MYSAFLEGLEMLVVYLLRLRATISNAVPSEVLPGQCAQIYFEVAPILSQTCNARELGTALHYAAKNGCVDRVALVMRYGANTGVLDSTGTRISVLGIEL